MRLLGLYFPLRRRKVPLFEYLLRLPASYLQSPTLLIGDFNTGRHHLDEAGATFVASEYMDRLEAAGWVDAWRQFHPREREYSWFSPKGNGFRVDHVFSTPRLLGAMRRSMDAIRSATC